MSLSASRTPRPPPSLTVDGRPAGAVAHAQPDGSWLALVTGLSAGRHRITARRGHGRADLRVDNHSRQRPGLLRPAADAVHLPDRPAFGLPPATPPVCSAPTQVSYLYKNTAGRVRPAGRSRLATGRPGHRVRSTVAPVPYIVRLEQGTIDRAVYQIAALYDGTAPAPCAAGRRAGTGGWSTPSAAAATRGFHQGDATGGVVNDLFLAQGYAVASSSLNVLDNNCSTIISAEAAMMVKEHFIEEYGPVAHTIGWGGSGGAIQQYDIADQYPGILDGIVPGVSFPDPFTTTGPVTDCRLLDTYFGATGNGFTPAQKRAVAGLPSYDTCRRGTPPSPTGSPRPTAATRRSRSSLRWDPVTNPTRRQVLAPPSSSSTSSAATRAPASPAARWTTSASSTACGACRTGRSPHSSSPTSTRSIGGFDFTGAAGTDSGPRPTRRRWPRRTATTWSTAAGRGWPTRAVIDQRIDLDLAGFGNDIHTTDWSYVMRARMTAAGTVGQPGHHRERPRHQSPRPASTSWPRWTAG